MNETLPTTPTELRPTASMLMLADGEPSVRRMPNANRVVIEIGPAAVHLDPESAAQLAADLIEAVAESGAGQVPDVLLGAFGQHADATHSIRFALSELEQHDAGCLASAAAVGRLRAALRETGEQR